MRCSFNGGAILARFTHIGDRNADKLENADFQLIRIHCSGLGLFNVLGLLICSVIRVMFHAIFCCALRKNNLNFTKTSVS